MKEIPLTQRQFALVDDADFDWLNQWKWHAELHSYSRKFTAARTQRIGGSMKIRIFMHRAILNAAPLMQVDHIDGDSLNNRRSNLRLCTNAQNGCNRGANRRSSSGYKGVHWSKEAQKWKAQIGYNNRTYGLGYFDDPVAAAVAYDQAAIRLHGEFARINFPPGGDIMPNLPI